MAALRALTTGFLIALAAFPTAAVSKTQENAYVVGAARADISPSIGTYLAGYGKDRKAEGLYDALNAKAVFIADAQHAIALVTLDSIGLTRPDILRIAHAAAQAIPELAANDVLVSSTHTHAGPDVVGLWGPNLWRSGRDDDYVDHLVKQATLAIVDAYQKRAAATLKVATAVTALDWVSNLSEPGLLDQQLSVMQFQHRSGAKQGASIATLTNYACHPTILGPDNKMVSADYLSGFYAGMAKAIPAGEHLFLQGAIGGWVQPLQGDRSIGLANQYGLGLAQHSQELLSRALPQPATPLLHLTQPYTVPLANWGFRLMLWLGLLPQQLNDGAMQTSTSLVRIGNSYFVTHPGETSPAYALKSRALLPGNHHFVMGLTQGAMGYILKPDYFTEPEAYPHGDYLVSVSVGEQAGPKLMQAIQTLANQLPKHGP